MKQPIFERAFVIGNAPSLKLCKWNKSLIRKIEVQKRKNEVQKNEFKRWAGSAA